MKQIHLLALCVVVLLHGSLHAQEPPLNIARHKETKPLLFGKLPEEFQINLTELQNLFSAELNEQIIAQLSDQFHIKGKIISKTQPAPATFSINIRLENYSNALFNLSARLLPDNSFYMQGRILHPKYGDVLMIEKNKEKYFFHKKSQQLILPD